MLKGVFASTLLLLAATAGWAGVRPGPSGEVAALDRADSQPARVLSLARALPPAERQRHEEALERLGVAADAALLEPASGRWATLRMAEPLIPGSGVGNELLWSDFGLQGPPADDALALFARNRFRDYVARHPTELGISPAELDLSVGVFEHGALVQVSARRRISDLAVRNARLTAVINHGNLVLLGASDWADIDLDPAPRLTSQAALAIAARHALPARVTGPRRPPALEILPLRSEASTQGYEHHLVWVLEPAVAGSIARWEALVDAHSGELLAFRDLNHYGTARNVNGGVYPASTDGVEPDGRMISNYPMPYADIDLAGFTDSGGNFDAVGVATTTLDGQFISIVEGCGTLSESGSGDLELEGTDGDTDCDVPAGHSAGDTAGARTAYYELNRIREGAASILPGNAWLAAQLTANVNIDLTCGAFWNGESLNFFRNSGSPCANGAELAGVLDHEWGHGLDDNDVDGSIPGLPQGGGEGVADLFAALRGNVACIGRGFFVDGGFCTGYGDPCTPASGCTGVRSIDYADRQSGLPHTLTWVRSNCQSGGAFCTGAAYSETVWDLMTRDLPAVYGMDRNTAMEVTRRLFLIGGGNAAGLFDFAGPPPGDAGCAADQAYLQYLAADDDDGDLDNGTPHMTAIAAAFDRLEIGCTPGGGNPGPPVQDSGCSPTPASAPVVTAAATDQGADLSWAAVADAAQYKVYRTDGERACDLGKQLVAATADLSFSDTGLKNGRAYSYVVLPMGAGGDSCFGPASACVTVGAVAIFADGFESGDTSAWSQALP